MHIYVYGVPCLDDLAISSFAKFCKNFILYGASTHISRITVTEVWVQSTGLLKKHTFRNSLKSEFLTVNQLNSDLDGALVISFPCL